MGTKIVKNGKSCNSSGKKRLPFREMGVDSAEWESLWRREVGAGACLILLAILRKPLSGRETSHSLEGAEESSLAGEARLAADNGNLHIGLFAEQLLCVAHTVFAYQLGEGGAPLLGEDVGNGADADVQARCHIREAQAALQIVLVLLQELADALHQLLVA